MNLLNSTVITFRHADHYSMNAINKFVTLIFQHLFTELYHEDYPLFLCFVLFCLFLFVWLVGFLWVEGGGEP